MKLEKHEKIIAAWASPASGPGWSNTPIEVLIHKCGGDMRVAYMQPSEQTPVLRELYDISAAVNRAMCQAVERHLLTEQDTTIVSDDIGESIPEGARIQAGIMEPDSLDCDDRRL